MREAGIWTCLGYGSSLTGITVTSSRSHCFADEFGSAFFVALPDNAASFLFVDDDVLALAFAEDNSAELAEVDLTGCTIANRSGIAHNTY